MIVHVPSADSTILEVRNAIMAKLGEANINKVKLVMQSDRGTKQLPDRETLRDRMDSSGRVELLMVGRPLA